MPIPHAMPSSMLLCRYQTLNKMLVSANPQQNAISVITCSLNPHSLYGSTLGHAAGATAGVTGSDQGAHPASIMHSDYVTEASDRDEYCTFGSKLTAPALSVIQKIPHPQDWTWLDATHRVMLKWVRVWWLHVHGHRVYHHVIPRLHR